MAVGFPPSYSTELELLGDRQSARKAVKYTFEILGWKYRATDPDHYQAKAKSSAMNWGEIFTVSLSEGLIKLHSSSGFWILPGFDGGKNKKNIEQFLIHFSHKDLRDFKTKNNEHNHLDEHGRTPVERMLLQATEKVD